MANEPPQNQGPGATPGKSAEMELDDVLSQATSLAAELNEEIGGAGGPPASPAPDPLTEVKASTSDSLECELNELERLVASTSAEITPESTDSASPVRSDSAPAGAAAPVVPVPAPAGPALMPDFMSEFTDPPPTPVESAAPAPNSAAAPAATAAAKPGVVSSAKVGVVGAATIEPDGDPAVPPSESVRKKETEAKGATERSPEAESEEHASGLLVAALAVCSKAVGLLEMLDHPFRWLGLAPRRLAGWLAIFTLAAASVVYVLSLW